MFRNDDSCESRKPVGDQVDEVLQGCEEGGGGFDRCWHCDCHSEDCKERPWDFEEERVQNLVVQRKTVEGCSHVPQDRECDYDYDKLSETADTGKHCGENSAE